MAKNIEFDILARRLYHSLHDRLLGLRFGAAAVRAIADRAFGVMVGLNGPTITRVPLADVVGRPKNVPLDSDIICTVRDLGISLGD